jgi:hypothetical protein
MVFNIFMARFLGESSELLHHDGAPLDMVIILHNG